jgi:dihydrofolate synthase/folylpolyglutamate synthase
LALAGQHQQENAMVALATLDFVHRSYSQIDVETIRQGLAFVQWPGRLQLLTHGHGRPTILLDCAHNVDSAQKLALTLTNDCAFDELWLLIGVTVDKDVRGVLNVLLPMTGKVILTASSHPRATTPAELLQLANELGFKPRSSSSVAEAIATVWQEAGPGDLICVTGSIFIVGDLLNQWEGLQSELLTISGQPPVRANSVIH